MSPTQAREKRSRRRGRPAPTPDELAPVRQKITRLLGALDRSFMERSTHVRMTLLAILAGHHVLLLGPPGTAKSLLARAVCECFLGTRFFEYLLSKFSHPDELFGPVSIPGLKEEDYRRLTEGYLPHAHIAFLDEIFKANSAILNSLLTLINERVFHHGKHRDSVPLIGLVGASNEPPDPEGGLGALYDRFLVRLSVPPIAEGENFLKVCLGDVPRFRPPNADRLNEEDITALRRAARNVKANDEVRKSILQIRARLEEAKIAASDRRWRWALELLKIAAVTSGRAEISLIDLVLLEHCFGDPGVDQATVSKHVRESLGSPVEEDTLLAPLAATWREQGKKPLPKDFEAWKQSAEGTIQALTAAIARAQQALDELMKQIEDAIAKTPWQTEAPPQILARITSLRAQLLGYEKAAQEYAAASRAYSPEASIIRWAQTNSENQHHGLYWHSRRGAGVVRVEPLSQGSPFRLDSDGDVTSNDPHGGLARAGIPLSDGAAYSFLVGSPEKLARAWSRRLAETIKSGAEKDFQDFLKSEQGERMLRHGYSPQQLRDRQALSTSPDYAEATLSRWMNKLRATSEFMPPALADPPTALKTPSNGPKRR